MRDELEIFVIEMENKLKQKDVEYGDSWKTMPLDKLMFRLKQEYREWEETGMINDRGTPAMVDYSKEELVDIANVCMMLYHRRLNMGD